MKQLFTVFLMMCSLGTFSQKKEIIYLWPGKVPGEVKEKQPATIDTIRKDNVLRYNEVTNPAIELFLPDPSIQNRSAIIVCPGGGYKILAYDKEGTEIAAWLNNLGFTAFVLQYRVPDNKDGALQDIQRAIRLVRSSSQKWNLDPEKIGVVGFSAGGSLSARATAAETWPLLAEKWLRVEMNPR
jgi:acetyl esterase/lipase